MHIHYSSSIDENKNSIIQKAASSSVIASASLTIMKFFIGIQTNSLGILAEALHSAIDLIAAIITLIAVKISAKPPDKEHHFGHGKFENVSALIETFLLWVTVYWILYEAYSRFTSKEEHHVTLNIWAFIIISISIVVDYFRAKNLRETSKKYESPALAADALHFQTDMYSSIAVLIGLVGISLGYVWLDIAIAVLIAIWSLVVSFKLAKDCFDQLTDKAPPNIDKEVLDILFGVQGIIEITKIKVRKVGPTLFLDLTISMYKEMTFVQVHDLTDTIEHLIKKKFPESEIMVHPEPK